MNYLRAGLRFWWVLVLGVGVGMLVAVWSVYFISLDVPPTLTKRERPTYTAATRLLVTSSEAPYFRTSVSRIVEAGNAENAPVIATSPPDTHTLVQAANLYPVLIESDQVTRLRAKLYGDIPGGVTAQAIFAVASPNRFELSQVPGIEVFATSTTESNAVRLAQATAAAFQRWIEQTQDRAKLTGRERIQVQQIRRPASAVPSATGGGAAMPMMMILVVVAAFFALAVVLDRLFPRGPVGAVEDLAGRERRRAPLTQRA